MEKHILDREDGRKLCVYAAGVPDGTPVFVHSGTPGSGLLYPSWIGDAEKRNIRLLSYDRPYPICNSLSHTNPPSFFTLQGRHRQQ